VTLDRVSAETGASRSELIRRAIRKAFADTAAATAASRPDDPPEEGAGTGHRSVSAGEAHRLATRYAADPGLMRDVRSLVNDTTDDW
jgi:Arc/MetJ-type ribon-helix-helix transcriptional regulator